MTVFKFIVGLFAFLGLLVLLGAGGVGYLIWQKQNDVAFIDEGSVLYLNLAHGLLEKEEFSFLDKNGDGLLIRDVIDALAAAENDARIVGVFATIGSAPIDYAVAQEISSVMKSFDKSGKFSLIFSEDMGVLGNGSPEYLLASSFQEIWLQPSGGVGLMGLALEMPFVKGALAKIGVRARFEQRHEFKGGADIFMADGLSDALRSSLQTATDELFDQLVEGISVNRKLRKEVVRKVVDNGPYTAWEALEAKLVDQLGYYDQATLRLKELAGDGFEFVGPAQLAAESHISEDQASAKVALIYGIGEIMPGDNLGDGFQPYEVSTALAHVLDDSTYDAVLLRINSPGGTYIQSDMIWREVRRLREADIPVVVSMGTIAASGGYFVAMEGNKIFAQPGTLTGSIGVYAGKFVTEDFWGKIGISWETVKSGDNSTMWSVVQDFSAQEAVKFHKSVDFIYEDFTSKVAAARNLDDAQLDAAARGRLWTGEAAFEAGLIDGFGGYREAIAEIKNLLELPQDAPLNFVVLPAPVSLFGRAMAFLSGNVDGEELVEGAARSYIKSKFGYVLRSTADVQFPVGILQAPPVYLVR